MALGTDHVTSTTAATFIPEVFPGVANFSTGIMFNPFGWASQVKLKQNLSKDFSLILSAYKEREFTTAQPTGTTQNSASINSALPSLNGQFQYKNKNIFKKQFTHVYNQLV